MRGYATVGRQEALSPQRRRARRNTERRRAARRTRE